MDSKQRQLANKYLDLFGRRILFITILFVVSLLIGLGVYLRMPKVYQAVSLLSYEQQKISPNKMSPDMVSRIRDVVSSLTQIVTSRTNLEKLINQFNLYVELRERLPMEDIVENMREQIEIKPSNKGDIFKIAFNYYNPDAVTKVTNSLAARFIEENLKYREERATETSSYTSDELAMAKGMMDRKENAMRDYKLKYYNEMPEQQVANVSRLNALQEQYQKKQDSIQDSEKTLVLIQDQINNRRQILKQDRANTIESDQPDGGEQRDQPVSKEVQLANLKLHLDKLLTRYTEMHPEIRKTRSIIAKLEKDNDIVALQNSMDAGNAVSSGRKAGKKLSSAENDPTDSVILQLETQYKNVQINIQNLNAEKEQLKIVITEIEKWVATAPVREAEWSSLTREYGQLKKHYDYLVSQDLEAKSMLNLERRQKGSQFKIEDPARYPEKPIKPNFIKIMAMAGIAGLGLGVGLTFAFDVFDGTFRDPGELESVFKIPLLATVPHIELSGEKRHQRRQHLLSLSFLGCLFVGVGLLFGFLWIRGYIVL